MCAPQFRCAQLWPHAHNPAPHPQQRVCEANWRRTTSAASLLRKHALAVDCPAGVDRCALPSFAALNCGPTRTTPHHIRNSVFAKQTGGAQRAPPVCFANTLLRLIAPRGQSLCAPQFRCAQLWPHAHNPAPHPQQRVCFANTLLRLIAPRGQSLCAPQFRCAQLWPHAHNPAPFATACLRNKLAAHNERRQFASQTRCG